MSTHRTMLPFRPWPSLIRWLLLGSLLWQTEVTEARQPNILLICADDLGYGELGCQGNTEIPTPHIDSLAAEGTRFTQGYVTAPYCSASRAGFMTGRYQTRFGYEFNPIGADNEHPDAGLPSSELTLAEHLKSGGYATGLIGKWHLGGHANYHPHRHGFDEFFGFTHEGHYFVPPPYQGVTTMLRRKSLPGGQEGRWISKNQHLILTTHMGNNEPAYDANNPIVRDGQPIVESTYLTSALAREASLFIRRHQERPFFLYLSFNAVHSPLQATNEELERFKHIPDIHRRIFAAMLTSMDKAIGRVLKTLTELQLENETLIFFLSDNGGPTRELTSKNGPLRGEKGTVYEGGLRVPFILKWPGKILAGKVEKRPVLSLDIFATAAAAANLPVPSNKPLDGVNLLSYLPSSSDRLPHENLYWRLGTRSALRSGDWKIVRQKASRKTGPSPGSWELYHLAEDISESNNLADQHPDQVVKLEALWLQMNKQMKESRWVRRRR